MTLDELKQHHATVYRTLMKERQMRQKVFRNQPTHLQVKLGEIDSALTALDALKDELKKRLEPQQLPLLDARRKAY